MNKKINKCIKKLTFLLIFSCLWNFLSQAQKTVLSTIEALQPLSTCDQQYIRDMNNTLTTLQQNANQNFLQTAQQYMIMVKQHIDLELRFRSLENTFFDTATIAELRKPLAAYTRCRNDLLLRPTAAPNSRGTAVEKSVTANIAPFTTPPIAQVVPGAQTAQVATVAAAPAA